MYCKAPFPYFGGKSAIAKKVWQALRQPDHYIEPFFGSGAVLLARPDWKHEMTETVNDKDGFICNVWRSIQFSPDETAKWCDWPVNHCDLMARKSVLLKNEERLLENLIADPLWHDPILAGYWIWAASCWIGNGLTSLRQRPHLGSKGMGVHKVSMTERIPNLGSKGMGVHKTQIKDIYEWFNQLSYRLRRVRVVCGDWSRVCGGNWQDLSWKTVGIYFDPPYGIQDRSKVYHCDSNTIAQDVMKFCIDRGKRKNYRIVLSGYDEYEKLADYDWRKENWIARGGYSNIAGKKQTRGKINRKRETIWYSPAIGQGGPIQTCLVGEELPSPF